MRITPIENRAARVEYSPSREYNTKLEYVLIITIIHHHDNAKFQCFLKIEYFPPTRHEVPSISIEQPLCGCSMLILGTSCLARGKIINLNLENRPKDEIKQCEN